MFVLGYGESSFVPGSNASVSRIDTEWILTHMNMNIVQSVGYCVSLPSMYYVVQEPAPFARVSSAIWHVYILPKLPHDIHCGLYRWIKNSPVSSRSHSIMQSGRMAPAWTKSRTAIVLKNKPCYVYSDACTTCSKTSSPLNFAAIIEAPRHFDHLVWSPDVSVCPRARW